MRLSDIIKKKNGKPDASAAPPSDGKKVSSSSAPGSPHQAAASRPAPPQSAVPRPQTSAARPSVFKPSAESYLRIESPAAPPSLSPAVSAETSAATASEIFAAAVKEAREIFASVRTSKKFRIPQSISAIIDSLSSDPAPLLLYVNRTTADNYIYSHSVNVCAISVLVGIHMGYDDGELEKLAICAFLHDAGMSDVADAAASKNKLSSSEMDKVKNHPAAGQNAADSLLDAPADIKTKVSQVILQTHERLNGDGYPRGLSLEKIDEFAKIIAVADTYEAMTHPRSYKAALTAHEAIKTIINEAENNFDPEVMKSFITVMSLYPVGSYVRLSNGEIARVMKTNENMPTRPRVKVIIDRFGKKSADARLIDLESASIVAIREAVDETKIKIEPKLALELQTQKWWIR